MPSTKVDIFNKALRRAHVKNSVQDPDERSKEAAECKRAYESAIRETLAAHDWNFARARVVGSPLADSEVISGYLYAYALPARCVKMRSIAKDHPAEPWPAFEVALSASGTARVVHANKSPAILVYTAFIDNPAIYDDAFISLASWRLASEIAGPLTKDLKRAKTCLDEFKMELQTAISADANEGLKSYITNDPDWIAARN